MTQIALFGGATYDPALDGERLEKQLGRVYDRLSNGQWWTLSELHNYAGGSEAAVSARIRDLRKPQFGGYRIERMRLEDGLCVYWMVK